MHPGIVVSFAVGDGDYVSKKIVLVSQEGDTFHVVDDTNFDLDVKYSKI